MLLFYFDGEFINFSTAEKLLLKNFISCFFLICLKEMMTCLIIFLLFLYSNFIRCNYNNITHNIILYERIYNSYQKIISFIN